MRRVRDSKGLRLKLERQAFGYFKGAKQTHIHIQEARPANQIATGIPQDTRRRTCVIPLVSKYLQDVLEAAQLLAGLGIRLGELFRYEVHPADFAAAARRIELRAVNSSGSISNTRSSFDICNNCWTLAFGRTSFSWPS